MWIANKAAEALNSAKKGITEMAKEIPADTSTQNPSDPNLKSLQRLNQNYKKRIDQMTEEISNYKDIIEKMLQEKPKLLNFKIIIGQDLPTQDTSQTSDENSTQSIPNPLTEEIESLKSQLSESILNKKNLSLELFQSKKIIEELSQNLELQKKNIEKSCNDFNLKTEEMSKKISFLENSIKSSNESSLKFKSRIQKTVSDIFSIIKNSFDQLGLTLPNVKMDQIGLEDIQEFIFTQCKYYEDSLNSFKDVLKSVGKEGKTLEDFKKIFLSTLNECKVSIKNSEKVVKDAETRVERVLKEKEEIFKINTKKDKRIETLIEQISKHSEELKICQELKDENPRLIAQVQDITKEASRLVESLSKSKENTDNLSQKLQKKKKKIETLKSNNLNLNKRIKALSQTLSEKDQQVTSLQEASSILSSEVSELKINSAQYKSASKKNLEEVTASYSSKLKDSEDKFLSKQKELEKKLKDLQNDSKDLKIENIQLNSKVKRMEELEKNLGYLSQQNSLYQSRIDKLNIEKEKLSQSIKEKDEILQSLNQEILIKSSSLQQLTLDFKSEKEGLLLQIKENENVKQEADNLLKRIEQEMLANERMIDKRVVSTFLLNYTSEKYNSKAKLQMLTALAEMLGMPNDERLKLVPTPDSGFFASVSGYLSRG